MLPKHPRPFALAIPLLSALLAAPRGAQEPVSEETIDFFQVSCASCHTIGGGPLTGPDLKGVSERRDREWLVAFLMDPRGVIDSGDPYAAKLLADARGVYMQPAPGMTPELANKLLDLVDVESAREKSRFSGLQLDDRPLTDEDVELGHRLFLGRDAFAAGAPACVSCHDVDDLAALGGGQLGPDLTSVYARLEGRKALGAWLAAPPSAVMQPLYRDAPLESDEILALVAFLKQRAEGGQEEAGRVPAGVHPRGGRSRGGAS